jgi:acetyl esterase/lipase
MISVPPAVIGNGIGRWMLRSVIRLMRGKAHDGVRVETRTAEGGVALRVYTPERGATGAALLWIHGGGLVIGSAMQDDQFCADTARELGIAVVSTDYRLAPDFPFPAALDDCHAAWAWLQRSAAELGIDPARVAIGGQSAGGGLAASLAQRIHDAGGVQPIVQWLFCPMLDDRTAARRELDAVGHFVWNNRSNRVGWGAYLGGAVGAEHVPDYAVPARRDDLRGLPPAWIGTGDIELFFDEDNAYAERLTDAGVACMLDIVPGAPHGFEALAPNTALAQAYVARARAWLREQLG